MHRAGRIDNVPRLISDGQGAPARPEPRSATSRRAAAILAIGLIATGALASTAPPPCTIVAFGDSYFGGYGVMPGESFPAQLERALRAHGHKARVVNAGIAGETTADGLARLDRTLAGKPDLIILELGANDAERGLDPQAARANLDAMIARIKAAHVRVLLCGATAPAEFGPVYQAQFDPIYSELAAKHKVALYPIVLQGVASDRRLIQADGEHPNPQGVLVMVDRMLPSVVRSLGDARFSIPAASR
jgi:acyl-CoA thioesterase-1